MPHIKLHFCQFYILFTLKCNLVDTTQLCSYEFLNHFSSKSIGATAANVKENSTKIFSKTQHQHTHIRMYAHMCTCTILCFWYIKL